MLNERLALIYCCEPMCAKVGSLEPARIEEAAEALREHWNLGLEAIRNLTRAGYLPRHWHDFTAPKPSECVLSPRICLEGGDHLMAKVSNKKKTVAIYRQASSGRYVSKRSGASDEEVTVTIHQGIGKPQPLRDAPSLRGGKTLSDLIVEER